VMIIQIVLFTFILQSTVSDYESTGDFWFQRGDFHKADLAYLGALRLAEDEVDRYRILRKHALARFRMGDYREARKALESIPFTLRKPSDDFTLALLKGSKGEMNQAKEILDTMTPTTRSVLKDILTQFAVNLREKPSVPETSFRLSPVQDGLSVSLEGTYNNLSTIVAFGSSSVEASLIALCPITIKKPAIKQWIKVKKGRVREMIGTKSRDAEMLDRFPSISLKLDDLVVLPCFKVSFYESRAILGYLDGPFFTLGEVKRDFDVRFCISPKRNWFDDEFNVKLNELIDWTISRVRISWFPKPLLLELSGKFTGARPDEVSGGLGIWGSSLMLFIQASGEYPIRDWRELAFSLKFTFRR